MYLYCITNKFVNVIIVSFTNYKNMKIQSISSNLRRYKTNLKSKVAEPGPVQSVRWKNSEPAMRPVKSSYSTWTFYDMDKNSEHGRFNQEPVKSAGQTSQIYR